MNIFIYGSELSGAVSMLDSPLLGPADVVGGIIFVGTCVIAGTVYLYDTNKKEESIPEVAVLSQNLNPDTIIYRRGSGTNTNLTPRQQDVTGLSYQLTKPEGKYTMTTIGAINSTGCLLAIQDGANHVSVIPVNADDMSNWIDSRTDAENKPYYLTILLKSISVKGGNCSE